MGRDIEDGKTQRHGRDSNELEIEKARWWWWWSRIFLSFLEKLSISSALFFISLSLFFPPLSRVGKKENPAIINRTLFHDTRGEPREEKVLDVG